MEVIDYSPLIPIYLKLIWKKRFSGSHTIPAMPEISAILHIAEWGVWKKVA